MTASDWRLAIRPNPLTPLIAVAGVWLLCAPLIAWGLLGEPGPVFAAFCAAFPLVITYYGLMSATGRSGHVIIDRDGFYVQRPNSKLERFEWSDVRRFFVGKFGASVVYEGMAVPHFEVADGTGGWRESWLPGNLGVPPDKLVTAMEHLRVLALQGWPTQPSSFKELLQQLVKSMAGGPAQ